MVDGESGAPVPGRMPAGLPERLDTGRPVRMDGAMNTELVREGLTFTTTEWLRVNVDAPDVVAGIHARYATAGAELHIANSFSAARHVLEAAGIGDWFESINRASVELCREAIDAAAPHRQWIAGSVSTPDAEAAVRRPRVDSCGGGPGVRSMQTNDE